MAMNGTSPAGSLGLGVSLRTSLRHALRRWKHRPGLAVTAVLILALGIGATTAVFSVVEAVLMRPLPWPAPDRLVAIHAVSTDRRDNPAFSASWNRGPISWPTWQALQRTSAFEEVGVWFQRREILGDARADIVEVIYASSSLLSILGVRPALGRLFTADEDYSESEAIVVSYEAWQRRFGGRSDVLGQAVVLVYGPTSRGAIKTIVGVLPTAFRFQGEPPEFLLPMGLRAENSRYETDRFLRAIGRLAPGVSLQAALAAADPLVRGVESPARRSARVISLAADQVGHAARPLWLLLGSAGLLMLVACANVAGLLLGEGRARRHEIAVRIAVGGSRRHILQQLVIEHLILAGAAAVAGLAIAAWLTPILVAMAPDRLPGLDTVGVDLRLGAFALGLGLATPLLFGLAPAIALTSTRVGETLSEGGREATWRRPAAQRAIVVSELALSLVLLVCASLFGETMLRLTSRPLGFDPAGLAVATISLTRFPGFPAGPGERSKPAMNSFAQRLETREVSTRRLMTGWTHTAGVLARLSGLPGVLAVAGVGAAPFVSGATNASIRAYGRPPDEDQSAQRQIVTEGYFQTMGLAILKGRSFELSDREGALVAVVSNELERRFFAGDAVGKRLVQGTDVYDVIGVVANARQQEFSDDEFATLYVLDRQFGSVNHLIIRTSGDANAVLPLVRQTITNYDPLMVVTSTTTMNDLLARSIAEERFRAMVSAVFGGAALVLAAVGLYGLAARRVAERRREIGVRMAVGASAYDVRVLMLRESWAIVGFGLLGGLPAAYGASHVARSLLFGVSPMAPHVFLLSSGVLAASAIVATLIPAYGASRIDPMIALRE